MTAEHFVAPFCATAIRRGALMPANPATAAGAAAAPGPFLERMRELGQALGVRLVPVSQKPSMGIILRTASAPQHVDDAANPALRNLPALAAVYGFGPRLVGAGAAGAAELR
jgi:hypothetical protein